MMKIGGFQRILALAVAMIGLGMAGPVWAQSGGLTGKATLQNGQPCAKCTVQIDRLDVRGTYHVKTDKHGEYVYIGLPIGQYKVTLLDPSGGVLYFFNNFHVGLGDTTTLNFNLPKEMKAQAAANPEAAKQTEEEKKEQQKFEGLKQFFDEGNQAAANKDYKTAIEAYQKALPLAGPKNEPPVLARLGESYENSHQYDEAVATYKKILELTPDNASIYNNLGSTYAQMNKVAEAQQAFQKAASLDPAHASTYYYNLGVIMYNQGKMDEAGDAFKKAISIDPKYADAYFYEGQALIAKASTDKNGKITALPGTVEAYQKYLELAPNGPNAPVAKQMIETLQGTVQTQYKKKGRG
jgi:Tfp pilus assembly protein PilF